MFIYVPPNIPLGVFMFVCQFVCLIIACTSTFFCISIEDDGIGWLVSLEVNLSVSYLRTTTLLLLSASVAIW